MPCLDAEYRHARVSPQAVSYCDSLEAHPLHGQAASTVTGTRFSNLAHHLGLAYRALASSMTHTLVSYTVLLCHRRTCSSRSPPPDVSASRSAVAGARQWCLLLADSRTEPSAVLQNPTAFAHFRCAGRCQLRQNTYRQGLLSPAVALDRAVPGPPKVPKGRTTFLSSLLQLSQLCLCEPRLGSDADMMIAGPRVRARLPSGTPHD